jgi:hypothetical protein
MIATASSRNAAARQRYSQCMTVPTAVAVVMVDGDGYLLIVETFFPAADTKRKKINK